MRFLAFLLLALISSPPVLAADLDLTLKTAAGRPVRDAVVTVHPGGRAPPGPVRVAWPMQMVQQNMQFAPFVLIVPVGSDVAFPNRDAMRHHVYSFSGAKTFELKLYGKDQTRSVHFDKLGVVAVGCNIHDSMVAFIKVVDTAFAAKSDEGGAATVRGLPRGPAVVRIWHPYARGAGSEVVLNVVVPNTGDLRQAATIDLRPPPAPRSAY